MKSETEQGIRKRGRGQAPLCRHAAAALAVVCAWLAGGAAYGVPLRYGLMVGIDEYDPFYISGSLSCCVNDANAFRERLEADASRWNPDYLFTLANSEATKAEVRGMLTGIASVALAGDVVVYYQSSHGGMRTSADTYLCAYDANYEDEELAADLAAFRDNVVVIVVVDACYSGGLFKGAGGSGTWDFAANVMRKLAAQKGSKGATIGWMTACDTNQTAWAGDPYSLFTSYLIGAFTGGDTNADNAVSFGELFGYAAPRTIADDPAQAPQSLNDAVLDAAIAADLFVHHTVTNNAPASLSEIPCRFTFEITNTSWCALGIAPSTDHDILIDDDPDLNSPYAVSIYGGTIRDFVVANGHAIGNAVHYGQVSYGVSTPYVLEAEWVATDLTVGVGAPSLMDSGEVLQVFQANLTASAGYRCSVDVSAGSWADLAVYVFKASRDGGSRLTADWRTNRTGIGGDEALLFTAPESGDYGIVVVNENGGLADYTITVDVSAVPVGRARLDFDGDGTNDLALAAAASGQVWHHASSVGTLYKSGLGNPSWEAAPGDYDGDGFADYAWFIPATRIWRVYESSNGYAERPRILFGGSNDTPVPADFDGDGKTDYALFRAASGKIRHTKSSETNAVIHASAFGQPTWLPAVADYDGDGKADFSWFIPATKAWRIYESSNAYAERLPRTFIGGPNDIPIPADYDGDGKADMALFRRISGKIRYKSSADGLVYTSVAGQPTWLPAIADYDGDGKADFSWFIPATKAWRIYESSNAYAERIPRVVFGASADRPILTPLLGW